jgi:hypothetical protein
VKPVTLLLGFALMLGSAGCEELIDSCLSGEPNCVASAGRCNGSLVEVCRGGFCSWDYHWEVKVDCATTGEICIEPKPNVAWCAAPESAPRSRLARATTCGEP